MNVTKQHYNQPIGWSWFSQACVKLPGSYSSTVSVGWIHLYHASVHSPTCACSSIKITADTTISSHPCCSLFSACSCKSCTWARQYSKIHRAFQDIHGSRKPGCNKRDRYSNLHFTWNNVVFRGHAHASSSAKLQHTQNVVRNHAYNSLLPWFAKESSVASYHPWSELSQDLQYSLCWFRNSRKNSEAVRGHWRRWSV